ncbi:uncharacterized protein LOC133806337 [Humulus lupulus]|uniref:uncharacterized protein LOC133806337 n=1 Tax=Humulus lupulus TaxID=3486 RepID=UPI002B4165DB|nr:uncharacterized protein LOC133806337 [Humulus lupulus]
MPSYVKFMKEILSKKRKIEDYETVALTEECGAILHRKLPQKLRDPDQSIKHPRGIIEDVIVNVDKFIFPVNFNVLYMEKHSNVGRPFLATRQALIDVRKGELRLRVQGDEVVFNVFKTMSYLRASDSCYCIDVIDNVVSRRRWNNDALEPFWQVVRKIMMMSR